MSKAHLTLDDRLRIETLLSENRSLRYIADRLDKSPSTVSREIKNHSKPVTPKCCDCIRSSGCTLHHVCGNKICRKKCRQCPKAKKYCQDFSKLECQRLSNSSVKLCNSCSKKAHCHLERRFYYGRDAHSEYKDTLIHSRDGFDLTAGQLIRINETVSPLVKRGQSIYHIVQSNKDSLSVSESTIRRLVSASEMDVGILDLPEAVRRRPRGKKNASSAVPAKSKTGHLYTDFLEHVSKHDTPVVQMDCVEGVKNDSGALLTLHFVSFHMQLVYVLPKHDAPSVVRTLDIIEESLGKELFAQCFPLILTDNGHEFCDICGMERSIFGGKRSRIFFCEPNRSDEKGECENNHKLIRKIIPKKTSIGSFVQSDMVLLTNHLNSYIRKSLYGKCPFELAMASMPDDFFMLLGLEKLPPEKVLMTPALLSK